VDPEHAKTAPPVLDDFARAGGVEWRGHSRVERQDRLAIIDALGARLDARRRDYVRRSSADEWQVAREQARLLAQAARVFEAGVTRIDRAARFDAMAENLAALLARDPRHKVLVWTSNELAARATAAPEGSLGTRLARTLGARYVALGSLVADGEILAPRLAPDRAYVWPDRAVLGAPAAPDVAEGFAAAGHARCFLDLHSAPRGEVAAWLATPQLVRQEDGSYSATQAWLRPTRLAAAFDGVVFVRTVTPARPNGARRW
jgi:erythromycin esterase